MKFPVTLNNDKKTLGMLAGILALILALPWFWQSEKTGSPANQAQQSDSDKKDPAHGNGVRAPRAFRGKRELDWIAKVDYVARTGHIEVDLRHRDIPINENLKVHANFRPVRSQRTTNSRWLTRQASGVYRSGDVHLDPGKWTMGLTGYVRSRLAFRIEQILDVK